MAICECGCKQEASLGKRFVRGHKRKGMKKSEHPELNFGGPRTGQIFNRVKEKISCLCECGRCGQEAKPGKRFIIGHNRRGIKHTSETIENISKSGIGRKPSQETIEKLRIAALGNKYGLGNKSTLGMKQSEKTKKQRKITRQKTYEQYGDAIMAKRMVHSGHKKFSYFSMNGFIVKMRSNWEIQYAQFLDSLNIIWKYEPKGFKLSTEKFYFPDFYLPILNEYHEVKGYLSPAAKEKMDLFVKEYPNEKLIIIRKTKAGHFEKETCQ